MKRKDGPLRVNRGGRWHTHLNLATPYTAPSALLARCAAARDGDCAHTQCPQLRDDEPRASGRHYPLDTHSQDSGD